MNLAEKRIVNIFKAFIEKVFVPQLSKMDLSSQQEWNKFYNMISAQQLNVGEIQMYVDSLPGLIQPSSRPNINPTDNKPTFFTRPKKESVEQALGSFNPSKTFGGQRARMMFPLKDFEQSSSGERQNYNFSKDFSKQKQDGPSGYTTQMVLPTLEKLFKVFGDNQAKLEKVGTFQMPTLYEPKNYYN